MPKYIVIRLHPIEPIKGVDFTAYLKKLTIKLYDIAHKKDGKVEPVEIGEAKYLDPIPAPIISDSNAEDYDPDTTIVQHYSHVGTGLDPITGQARTNQQWLSVATAFVAVKAPAATSWKEYQSSDLRIEVKRDGKTIIKSDLNFNVIETQDYPNVSPAQFVTEQAISFYIALPEPKNIDLNTAILELPEDGRPPNFNDLYGAVKTVLVQEGATNTDTAIQARLREITTVEARYIAFEIMHHPSVYPPPQPKVPLEAMYTEELGVFDDDNIKQARQIFEADLVAHKTNRAAQAERLTPYVYSLAMAFVAQKMSADAQKVGFTFPINPTSPDLTKIPKAKVVLKN